MLVERYLHILRQNKNLNIDQIVAITFTNRAANEMRERLRKRLDELLETAGPEERKQWMDYKRTLDGAIITTIHGFCSRLLREFPVEAQVDPQFILLDEHQAATLLENAVEESLTEFINSGHEAISRLTAGAGRGRLAETLVELYRNVRGQGLHPGRLNEQAAQSHSTWTQYRAAFSEVDRLISDLIAARQLPDKAEARRIELQRNWPRMRGLLLDEHLPLADYCREIAEFREAARPTATGRVSGIVKQLDVLFWGEKREKPYGQVPVLRFDLVAKEYASEALKVLTSIDSRLEETKRQLTVLDFDDLQIRALKLLDQPEVVLRAARRYKFFLVDEFQDTNPLQRDLMDRLALKNRKDSNLFIVGDPKQSIYGFRGADVGVFGEMSEALVKAGGTERPLRLNFRSQPQLISFFNLLFARLFTPGEGIDSKHLNELGFVKHEPSHAEREEIVAGPLVEFMIDTLIGDTAERKAHLSTRERDAQQLARRILSLVNTDSAAAPPGTPHACGPSIGFQYRDIALLFRAMTDVPVYELAFRHANIPYQTVLGKGFYEREEITDLIQLLRFLDNRTDELALAAVLRSPLCGISDNALLALRLAPAIGETQPGTAPQPLRHPRRLFQALRHQSEIDFIASEEREALDRASEFLRSLIDRRNRYPVVDLLRFAVNSSEYTTVIAANFDGAQRLTNVEKLFTLAERFERSGAHLIRDFVKYVRDFEAIGSRESEGQLDEAANAVTLMTIHQAKGLEFPVVIIPDLQRIPGPKDNWFLLDRHLGLTVKVPDGRGNQVTGGTFLKFSERAKQREQFENLRLLYVAATRAEDRLILSAVTDEPSKLNTGRDCWLKWIWQALELHNARASGVLDLGSDVQLQFTHNLSDEPSEVFNRPAASTVDSSESSWAQKIDSSQSPSLLFPLLRPVAPKNDRAVHRFSVTQLINYQRCPRQYYFNRVLHVPRADELAVWNDAEAPEPPANLTATLKGAVIHRFCETYSSGENPAVRLQQSFDEVILSRQAQIADRLLEINRNEAMKELLPLAQNYLSSEVFQRIERARKIAGDAPAGVPGCSPGLWSELGFRLRRPQGILTGTIDKLLISPSQSGTGFDIEIIDFKTNRISSPALQRSQASSLQRAEATPQSIQTQAVSHSSDAAPLAAARRARAPYVSSPQFSLNFSDPTQRGSESNPETGSSATVATEPLASALPSAKDQIRFVASDYELQMQAYALAVLELIPGLVNAESNIKVTLHFIEPNLEFHLPQCMLAPEACSQAIDKAMMLLISSREPEHYPVRPATHCRMCSFLRICKAGMQWMTEQMATNM